MGQVNSNSAASSALDAKEKIRYQEFVKNYQFLRRIKDPRYGDISILQDKFTKELVALRESISKSTKDFDKDMTSLRARYKISHPNIVKVLGYTSKSEDHLCASVHKILMIVEYLDNDLEKEISLKKSQNNYYKEEQLWYLAENIIKALSLLQKNSICHEDLKPGSIFISKMGVYKIAQHNFSGNTIPAYHQRLSGAVDSRTYLSPELLENLQRYELRPKHNPWKSDVFSLGMTLLHTATLTSCDRLYDWNNQTIDFEELGEKLASLRPRYSENFQDFVQTMLEVADELRPDFVALESKLQIALDPTKKLNPTPGHSPVKGRRNETSQDVPDAFEDINSYRTVGQVKAKLNINGFSGYENYPQRNVNTPAMLSQESRIVSIRDAERPVHLPGKSPTQNTLHSNVISERRSPKISEHQRNKEISSGKIFKEALPVESNKHVVDINFAREPRKIKHEKEELEREKDQLQPVKPSKAFINSYHNEFSDHGLNGSRLNGSTQLTDAPPSINALSSIGRNEDKTVVSSINELHSLNVIQEQPSLQQLQENQTQEPQNGRRKSLISNEVARIISEFRTKMGIQSSSLENTNPAPVIQVNTRNDQENQKTPHQVVSTVQIEKISEPCDQRFDTFNHQFKELTRNLKMEHEVHHSNDCNEFNQRIHKDQYRERGFAPLNPQPNISPKTQYNLSAEINPESFQPDVQNRRISQQYHSYYDQQKTNPQYVRNNSYYTPQTSSKPSQQNLTQMQIQQSNSRTKSQYPSNDLAYSYQPETKKLSQIYNNSAHVNQNNPNMIDSYSKKGQFNQIGNYQAQKDQEQMNYNSNERQSKQQAYVFTDGYEVNPNEDTRPFNSRAYYQASPQADFNPSEVVNETYPDGSVYEGQKQNNLRHGKGTFYYSDGGMYTGDWVSGSMEGFGTLFYAGGSKAYEGEWREDKFHGKGVVYNEMAALLRGEFDFTNFNNVGDFWVKYEGFFANDNKEGNGFLLLSNGERFQGHFQDDMVSGRGVFHTLKGRPVKGEWWQNKLVRQLM